MYCIVLYLLPVLNPESYDGARVLEASGRPMLVIGRSYGFDSIHVGVTKFADETTENSGEVEGTTRRGLAEGTTKLALYCIVLYLQPEQN